ncbi:MAG: ferritin family protein [Myxococcaceae bacterium]
MATTGIDFSKLTLMDALDLAVLIEEEARDRYEELAVQMEEFHTPEAGHFFRKMIKVEEMHRAALDNRRKSLFADAPRRVSRTMIFDVEAPEYDQVRASMTPFQALQAALVSETKAHDFFVGAIAQINDPAVKLLFEELRDEEVEHQGWVKREMALKPEVKDVPGDVADEPNAVD